MSVEALVAPQPHSRHLRSDQRYRLRHYAATYPTGVRKQDARIYIPEDVERREFDAPCFRCEANGACKHRAGEGE